MQNRFLWLVVNDDMGDPRGATKRGKTEKCEVCGSTSNLWVLAGAPGVGWRLLCPLWKKTRSYITKFVSFMKKK